MDEPVVWSTPLGIGGLVSKENPDAGVGAPVAALLALQLTKRKHVSPDAHGAADPSGQGVFTSQFKAASLGSLAQTLTLSGTVAEDEEAEGAFV